MAYYAREFCKITGLKPDTLRFYVDKGLVSPTVNPENQYKQYSGKDVVDMFYVRSRRAIDVPITNIDGVLTKLPLITQLEWLKEHEQTLLRSIREMEQQLRRCQKVQRDIQKITEQEGEVIEMSSAEGPDLIQLDLVGPGAARGEKKYHLASCWREMFPYLLSSIFVPLEELLDPFCEEYSVTFGVTLPRELLEQDPDLMVSPVYTYPSRDNIGMLLRLTDPFHLTRRDLQPLLDYAQSHSYTFTDGLTSWLVTKSVEDGVEYYYFAVRVSVRHPD